MSETLRSLIAGIISNPDEDTPRLMYADELLESGCPLDAKLSEYIKLSIELSNHRSMGRAKREGEYEAPIRHGKFYEIGQKLVDRLDKMVGDVRKHPQWLPYQGIGLTGIACGFIRSIECTATKFLSICDKLIWHESMTDDVYLPDPASGRTTGEWISGEKVYRPYVLSLLIR